MTRNLFSLSGTPEEAAEVPKKKPAAAGATLPVFGGVPIEVDRRRMLVSAQAWRLFLLLGIESVILPEGQAFHPAMEELARLGWVCRSAWVTGIMVQVTMLGRSIRPDLRQ